MALRVSQRVLMPISKAKMRERKKLDRELVNPKSILSEGITKVENLLDPPAILSWLIPGTKREKLGRILEQFGKRVALLDVTYLSGIPLSEVTELYEATG